MKPKTLFIKGMVCNRCIMTVENEIRLAGYVPVSVSLGEVSFLPGEGGMEKGGGGMENGERGIEKGEGYNDSALRERLLKLGFSFLEDKNQKTVREIKNLVAEVYGGDYDFPEKFRFSDLVRQLFQKDYDTVSDAFIASERKSIEQYIIGFRINKVKEYLVYSDRTLADIAFRLNFNSVPHLSSQFKQHTGLTPSHFRNIRSNKLEAET